MEGAEHLVRNTSRRSGLPRPVPIKSRIVWVEADSSGSHRIDGQMHNFIENSFKMYCLPCEISFHGAQKSIEI